MKNKIINLFIILVIISITLSSTIITSEKINPGNNKCPSDQIILTSVNNLIDYHYRLFYIGRIEDLNRQENSISFDAINLYRISFMRSNDWSFWEYSISHYEDTYHQHEDFRFFGLLTGNIIFGFFFK